MMRGLPCLALTCALSFAAIPAFAGKTAASKHPPTPDKAAQARDKAQLAFQRDLVSVLAPAGDPLSLLGAALLARPLFNQSPSNSFHRLIERAAMAEGAGVAVSWVQLADCDADAGACPNPAALERLLAQAPDNAAVWLLKLGSDARAMKQDAVRDDLARAAAAKVYDDYAGISLKALAGSAGVLPPPAGTLDPAHAGGAVGMQAVLVFGLAGSQPQPSLPLIAKLCENAGDDASIKADCLKLGQTLEWGSSPLARSTRSATSTGARRPVCTATGLPPGIHGRHASSTDIESIALTAARRSCSMFSSRSLSKRLACESSHWLRASCQRSIRSFMARAKVPRPS